MTGETADRKLIIWIVVSLVIFVLPWIVLAAE
jgi:hypothetical protein